MSDDNWLHRVGEAEVRLTKPEGGEPDDQPYRLTVRDQSSGAEFSVKLSGDALADLITNGRANGAMYSPRLMDYWGRVRHSHYVLFDPTVDRGAVAKWAVEVAARVRVYGVRSVEWHPSWSQAGWVIEFRWFLPSSSSGEDARETVVNAVETILANSPTLSGDIRDKVKRGMP